MIKKTISCFILLVLVLFLAACSDENLERFVGYGFDTPDEPISSQHQSFVGYVENISFDSRNSASGYLTLRGDPSDSGITPYIRVRVEEGVTEPDISLPDLVSGQRVSVYHTLKGAAVLITMPLDASPTDVTHPPQSDSAFEIGRVRLASGDIEHEPGEHFLHGAMNTENGLLSALGIPFEFWLGGSYKVQHQKKAEKQG